MTKIVTLPEKINRLTLFKKGGGVHSQSINQSRRIVLSRHRAAGVLLVY